MINFAEKLINMSQLNYADVIVNLLKQKEITQSDLASKIGTSQSNLSERIRRNSFKQKMIDDIGRVLKADINELAIALTSDNSRTRNDKPAYTITITDDELKAILMGQAKSERELRNEIKQLRDEMLQIMRAALNKPDDKS